MALTNLRLAIQYLNQKPSPYLGGLRLSIENVWRIIRALEDSSAHQLAARHPTSGLKRRSEQPA